MDESTSYEELQKHQDGHVTVRKVRHSIFIAIMQD